MLEGLLENNTVLRLREHYTDTHGFTEHIFGLCYLLGYSFMPRLRDLAELPQPAVECSARLEHVADRGDREPAAGGPRDRRPGPRTDVTAHARACDPERHVSICR